jgi:hypothetical protein
VILVHQPQRRRQVDGEKLHRCSAVDFRCPVIFACALGLSRSRQPNEQHTRAGGKKIMAEDEICVTIIEGRDLAVKDSCGSCPWPHVFLFVFDLIYLKYFFSVVLEVVRPSVARYFI